eukprot:RCo014258
MAQAKLGLALFGLGSAFFAVKSAVFIVDAGESAVVFDRFRGVLPHHYGEGINFVIPILQTPYTYDIRIRPREISTRSGTKDQQQVNIKLRVLHRPIVEKLPWLFETYGMDYDERILPSIGNEILKAVVAQFNAEELITKRELVSLKIRQIMEVRARTDYGMVLDDISLMDVKFSQEFMHAVEMKQVAQQEAERYKYVVDKNEQEKQAAIVRAEGEAEAASLISKALTKAGNGLIMLRRIEAAREIAKRLSESGNVTYVPKGANVLLSTEGGGSSTSFFSRKADPTPPMSGPIPGRR